MYADERRRKDAIACEGEQRARRAEHIARRIPEHRHGCANQHEQATAAAQHPRGGLRKRRGCVGRHRGAEQPLRHSLNQQIQRRGDRERQEQRARNGARRIGNLAARHERDLEADERENQHDRGPPDLRRSRHGRPLQVVRVHEPDTGDHEDQQRNELGGGDRFDEPRARGNAAHVHERQRSE